MAKYFETYWDYTCPNCEEPILMAVAVEPGDSGSWGGGPDSWVQPIGPYAEIVFEDSDKSCIECNHVVDFDAAQKALDDFDIYKLIERKFS